MKKIFEIIFGLSVLSGLIYVVWLIINKILNTFLMLNSEVSLGILSAAATVMVSVISVVFGKYYEKKLTIERELRDKKIPVYENFISFMMDFLYSYSKSEGNQKTDEELIENFNKFTQELLIWGSDEVIKQWSYYKKIAINSPDSERSSAWNVFEFEKLIKVIRKDIGQKNKNLKQGEILRLFVNDIDEYLDNTPERKK